MCLFLLAEHFCCQMLLLGTENLFLNNQASFGYRQNFYSQFYSLLLYTEIYKLMFL